MSLSYIPAPKPLLDLRSYINNQYEDFARRLNISEFFNNAGKNSDTIDPLRPVTKKSTWMPDKISNMLKEYLENVRSKLNAEVDKAEEKEKKHFLTRQYSPPWLLKTLSELKENKDIIITEADKNMGVAVVKTSEYIHLGLKQLLDPTCYKLCPEAPNFNKLWASLKTLLRSRGYLYDPSKKGGEYSKTALYLLQLEKRADNSPNPNPNPPAVKLGTFYMLMKVHKTPLAGRPIVSSINTITYFVSKFIDLKLQPIYKRIPTFLGSSQELIIQLEDTPFHSNKNCYILCADVDSLYPSIPLEKGLEMMKKSLIKRNAELDKGKLKGEEIELICALMKFVLENNYFTFGNLIFQQKQGTAMGTPAAVVFACLFLDAHETRILEEMSPRKPLLLKRYIDDIFGIFEQKEDAELFLSKFSSDKELPTIKCSSFTIDDKEGTFLDLKIFKGDRFESSSRLDIKVFQKPQNKYLYLPPNSFHPKAVFPAYIKAEINRYRLICSSDDDFEEVKEEFRKRLLARGYTEKSLEPLFVSGKSRTELLLKVREQKEKKDLNKGKFIFKTLHHPQVKALNIKSCLKLTERASETYEGDRLFKRQDPIICYSYPPAIRSFFSQKRNKIHDLSLQPVANNNRSDVDKMIENALKNTPIDTGSTALNTVETTIRSAFSLSHASIASPTSINNRSSKNSSVGIDPLATDLSNGSILGHF